MSDIQFDGGPDINTGWVWQDEDGNVDAEVDEIVVFTDLKVDDSDTYTGTLTDANGCISSLNFEVIVNQTPDLVTRDTSVCEVQSVELTNLVSDNLNLAGSFNFQIHIFSYVLT